MADRVDYFFRQKLTEQELDEGFDKMEDADRDMMADQQIIGILAAAVVSQHAASPDLTVDVSGPGIIYDQAGQRLFFSALQNVNMALDENGASTDVASGGNEKTLALFVEFDRLLSDPRLDGNSVTVFYQRTETVKFNVVQSAEAAIGNSVPPALRNDQILLADIVIENAQTQILNVDIEVDRREDGVVLTGTPSTVRTGRVIDGLQDLLDIINALPYEGGGSWAGGTGDITNPVTTVELQLDKIITDLSSIVTDQDGLTRIGMGTFEMQDAFLFGGADVILSPAQFGNEAGAGALNDLIGTVAPMGTWRLGFSDIPEMVHDSDWNGLDNQGSISVNGITIQCSLGRLFKTAGTNAQYHIEEIRMYINDTSGSTISVELYSRTVRDSTAMGAALISIVTSDGSGSDQTLTLAGGDTITPGTNKVFIIEIATQGGGAALRKFYGMEIDVGYSQ